MVVRYLPPITISPLTYSVYICVLILYKGDIIVLHQKAINQSYLFLIKCSNTFDMENNIINIISMFRALPWKHRNRHQSFARNNDHMFDLLNEFCHVVIRHTYYQWNGCIYYLFPLKHV